MAFRKYKDEEVTRYVGIRLKYFRQQKRLTQQDVGSLLGVSHQQYQKYEEGDAKLAFYRLLTLASFYQVSLNKFVPPDLEHLAGPSSPRGFREAPVDHADELEAAAALLALIPHEKARQHILGLIRTLARAD